MKPGRGLEWIQNALVRNPWNCPAITWEWYMGVHFLLKVTSTDQLEEYYKFTLFGYNSGRDILFLGCCQSHRIGFKLGFSQVFPKMSQYAVIFKYWEEYLDIFGVYYMRFMCGHYNMNKNSVTPPHLTSPHPMAMCQLLLTCTNGCSTHGLPFYLAENDMCNNPGSTFNAVSCSFHVSTLACKHGF